MTLRFRLASLAAAGALSLGSVLALPAPAQAEGDGSKILLMLDASGSMNGADPSGLSKIDAAKGALKGSLDALPPQAQVGLRVYGATQPGGKPTPEACRDTQLVRPLGPLDKGALVSAIDGFAAKGETPIAFSLAEAVKDLGPEGRRHIILVSDGEESCVPDPCPEVRTLVGSGVSLQIDTVGFGVDDTARDQLQCIAQAGHGTYYDAKDAATLESSLRRLNTRSARAFTIQGTPVVGTPDAATAPVLEKGQYTDTVMSSSQGETRRSYRVRRTLPGSTLRVSILGRAPAQDYLDSTAQGGWDIILATAEGQECDARWNLPGDNARFGLIRGNTVVALPLDPLATSPRPSAVACADATELHVNVRVQRAPSAADVPVEIRVIEEPPVTNAADLPRGVADVPEDNADELTSPAQGDPQRVVAGASLNDAPALPPGTYETEIVPGEIVFVKTTIDWGQRAVLALDGPDPAYPGLKQLGRPGIVSVKADVYAPDFSQMDSQEFLRSASYHGGVTLAGTPDINEVPEVRYRNRWDSPAMNFSSSRGFAMAGDYHLALGLGDNHEELRGQPVPVRFSIAVTGTPSGRPHVDTSGAAAATGTAGAAPEASSASGSTAPAAPASGTPGGGGVLPWVGGALIGLATLGGVGYAAWRRRGTPAG